MSNYCVRKGREPLGCKSSLDAALALGKRASSAGVGRNAEVRQLQKGGAYKVIARCHRGTCTLVSGAGGLNGTRRRR